MEKAGCDIRYNCPLTSTFGCTCVAEKAIFPRNFTAAVKAAKECEDALVLGGISNTLILNPPKEVICMRELKGIIEGGADLYVMSGESLNGAARWARMRALSGMEQLGGIPGTVGGALAGNSGCYGRQMSDITLYADVVKDGRVERIYAKDLNFSYRSCSVPGVILGVMLRLTPSDGDRIEENMRVWQAMRAATQPGRPSLGCTFKKCGEVSCAYYIEKAGYKGYAIQGAQVSEKHAGFIVNTGTATAANYYDLAEKVRTGVKKFCGITPEYEINIIK